METLTVECLRCGETRRLRPRERGRMDAGQCERCDYVGWALVADLSERARQVLRERPPERRRLYAT